jgi:hypothetical protein
VSGVGLLALWKEKKVRMLWPVRSYSAAQTPAWSTGEAPLINSEFVSADSFPVYPMIVLRPHALPNENLKAHIHQRIFFFLKVSMTKDYTARIEIRTFGKAAQRHVGSKIVRS